MKGVPNHSPVVSSQGAGPDGGAPGADSARFPPPMRSRLRSAGFCLRTSAQQGRMGGARGAAVGPRCGVLWHLTPFSRALGLREADAKHRRGRWEMWVWSSGGEEMRREVSNGNWEMRSVASRLETWEAGEGSRPPAYVPGSDRRWKIRRWRNRGDVAQSLAVMWLNLLPEPMVQISLGWDYDRIISVKIEGGKCEQKLSAHYETFQRWNRQWERPPILLLMEQFGGFFWLVWIYQSRTIHIVAHFWVQLHPEGHSSLGFRS
jgi:hypothetical protein